MKSMLRLSACVCVCVCTIWLNIADNQYTLCTEQHCVFNRLHTRILNFAYFLTQSSSLPLPRVHKHRSASCLHSREFIYSVAERAREKVWVNVFVCISWKACDSVSCVCYFRIVLCCSLDGWMDGWIYIYKRIETIYLCTHTQTHKIVKAFSLQNVSMCFSYYSIVKQHCRYMYKCFSIVYFPIVRSPSHPYANGSALCGTYICTGYMCVMLLHSFVSSFPQTDQL